MQEASSASGEEVIYPTRQLRTKGMKMRDKVDLSCQECSNVQITHVNHKLASFFSGNLNGASMRIKVLFRKEFNYTCSFSKHLQF